MNKNWLQKVNWGIICHYLAAPASTADAQNLTANKWNQRINNFKVDTLIENVLRAKADYFIITIGQNSGFYISPNATYDSIVEREESHCSKRDLMGEIAEGLYAENIPVIAYLPSHAPSGDIFAVKSLGCIPNWDPSKWQLYRELYTSDSEIDDRLTRFQNNWEAVIREWSERWGNKIQGWWFDGCYYAKTMYENNDAPNFNSFAGAARSGNPNAIVTFNQGASLPIEIKTEVEDYTAGEVTENFPVNFEITPNKKLHIMTYLSEFWGHGKPRLSADFVNGYTKLINEKNGIVSWDIPIQADGALDVDSLKILIEAMK